MASSLIHFIGFGLVLFLWLPYQRAEKTKRVESVWIFGFGAMVVLFLSGLFHGIRYLDIPHFELYFRKMDHSGIWICFLFTVLAIHHKHLNLEERKTLDRIVILVSACGLIIKNFYFAHLIGWPGLIVYTVTFLVGGISLFKIYRKQGFQCLKNYIYGIGLLGAAALLERNRVPKLFPGAFSYHEIFHILVLIALVILWVAISKDVKKCP